MTAWEGMAGKGLDGVEVMEMAEKGEATIDYVREHRFLMRLSDVLGGDRYGGCTWSAQA